MKSLKKIEKELDDIYDGLEPENAKNLIYIGFKEGIPKIRGNNKRGSQTIRRSHKYFNKLVKEHPIHALLAYIDVQQYFIKQKSPNMAGILEISSKTRKKIKELGNQQTRIIFRTTHSCQYTN